MGYPTAYEITHFAASQNIASGSTRYARPQTFYCISAPICPTLPPILLLLAVTGLSLMMLMSDSLSSFNFSFSVLPNLTIPVQMDHWSAFNAAGQLSQYDVTFKWWQWTVDYLLGTAAHALNMTSSETTAYVTQKLVGSICDTSMTYCNSTVKGLSKEDMYQSADECKGFLTKQVRFGEAYELGTYEPQGTMWCPAYELTFILQIQGGTLFFVEWCIRAWSLFALQFIARILDPQEVDIVTMTRLMIKRF